MYEGTHNLDLCVKCLLSISGKLYSVMALIQDLLMSVVFCHFDLEPGF